MALPRSAAAAFLRPFFRTPQRLTSSSQSLTRAISRRQFIARTRQPTFAATRSLTNSSSSDSKLYDFQQIQKLSSSPSKEKVLIDVREPSEYTAGYIPTAINLPIKSQPDALFLPAEEFLDRFGFEKPQAEQEVVFYCKSGVRSQAAASLARQVGYKQVSEYRGSWMDWEKNGGQGAKP
ncbi:rhodanese domain protein [Zymoseptoria brevis]|uniref:Rhodanese domain protein n=1 Tax=Zymoseptoria brevis TaxID=1047168 RepID=A0A0F4GQY1_9PEZI|nr:rhodanese domain protein [Zymoseptoria brevis]